MQKPEATSTRDKQLWVLFPEAAINAHFKAVKPLYR